jgi:hypothetical protein
MGCSASKRINWVCVLSPELAAFFYASFLLLGLVSSRMCSFVVGLT